MKRKSETIAFRAGDDLLKSIDQQREPFGISRGDWVRGIVVTWINLIHQNQQVGTTPTVDLDEVLGRLDQVHRNQAKVLYMCLTVIGNVPPNDARDMVRKQLMNGDE